MMMFSEVSTRRSLSPWGIEVKKQLLQKNMRQDELLQKLRDAGYQLNKGTLSNLLYGLGASKRQPEIKYISDLLDIPYS